MRTETVRIGASVLVCSNVPSATGGNPPAKKQPMAVGSALHIVHLASCLSLMADWFARPLALHMTDWHAKAQATQRHPSAIQQEPTHCICQAAVALGCLHADVCLFAVLSCTLLRCAAGPVFIAITICQLGRRRQMLPAARTGAAGPIHAIWRRRRRCRGGCVCLGTCIGCLMAAAVSRGDPSIACRCLHLVIWVLLLRLFPPLLLLVIDLWRRRMKLLEAAHVRHCLQMYKGQT